MHYDFFFSSRRRHTRLQGDWSSDVCSSDLGDDPQEVDGRVQAFLGHLGADASVERLGHTLAAGNAAVHRVYAMRKRAVGLLGNVAGEARPQPFVEDTAVPPENLRSEEHTSELQSPCNLV